VVPRPIGWISTLSPTGQANLAPYSQFNNLTFDPPYVMFSANQTPTAQQKDTVKNTEATGKFCWNLATYDLREAVNITAEQTEYGVDEFERAGLEKVDSKINEVDVQGEKRKIPMVRDSPVRFECEYYTTLRLPGAPPVGSVDVVIGRVVGIHIDERVLTDGKVDIQKTGKLADLFLLPKARGIKLTLSVPIARCGYYEYAVIRDVFEMKVPGLSEDIMAGLEGNSKKLRAAIEERDKNGVMRGDDAEVEKED
jgi:flavin reductase (DIM6/NTAB) family NADH-FMN oxidoreductase RutF